jgi:hypothetical protein
MGVNMSRTEAGAYRMAVLLSVKFNLNAVELALFTGLPKERFASMIEHRESHHFTEALMRFETVEEMRDKRVVVEEAQEKAKLPGAETVQV